MRTLLFLPLIAIMVVGACGGDGGGDGGGDDDGAGDCGKVAACGGNVVGDWNVKATCVQGTLPVELCPSATADLSGLKSTGIVSYKADGTYSSNTTVSGKIGINYPQVAPNLTHLVSSKRLKNQGFQRFGAQ